MPEIQRELAREMDELLPLNLRVPAEGDLFSFELTAHWLNQVARYIIGIAAAISGDLNYAGSIFGDLERELSQVKINLPQIMELKRRVPANLAQVHLAQARLHHQSWRKTRSITELEKVHLCLTMVEKTVTHPDAYLMRAIYFFVAERNIKAALSETAKCKEFRDPTWRYSKAFLEAYRGRMDEAERVYRIAFKQEGSVAMYFEVEEFIDWILEIEPTKVQFYYCLGLINYYLKGDVERAKRDFECFLGLTSSEKFPKQREKAQQYISQKMNGISKP